MTMRTIVWVIAAVAMCLVMEQEQARAQAQTIPWRTLLWNDVFATFDSSAYMLGVNTSYDASARNVMLTPSSQGQTGRLILLKRSDMDYFDASFDVYLGYMSTLNSFGADGIVFACMRETSYPAIAGGHIDFDGCNGFGVEFDTYHNGDENDPSEEHIAVIEQAAGNHLAWRTLISPALKDNRWHSYSVRNRGGNISVRIGASDAIAARVNSGFEGWFGFTAATAFAFNEHRVDNVSVSVQARERFEIGVFSACDTVVTERTIRIVNNHPDPDVFTIRDITFTELDGSGEFSLLGNPAPVTIPKGDSVAMRVRFAGTGPGLRRALLRAFSENGEELRDTIMVELVRPSAEWSATSIVFAPTHAGATRDTVVTLVNTSAVPVRIDTITITSGSFSVLSPSSFPVLIPPGDSITVLLRFSPAGQGSASGTLALAACGVYRLLLLTGDGFIGTLRLGFPQSPLMLHPNQSDTLSVSLENDPRGMNVRGMHGHLRFDPAIVSFVSASADMTVWSDTGSLLITEPFPGNVAVTLRSALPLNTPGFFLTLRFEAVTSDTGCSSIWWDNVGWNPEGTPPGVPFGSGGIGRICINPSCRIPQGLRLASSPTIAVHPNPTSSSGRIVFRVPADCHARISIVNALGVEVAAPFDSYVDRGEHSAPFTAIDLPPGSYRAVLRAGDACVSAPVLLLR
jgi:hypothetical protein